MRLSELLKSAGIDSLVENGDCEITGVTSSTRQVKEGMLFLAIEGLHTDGHRFIEDAIACGAVAAVVSKTALESGRVSVSKKDLPLVAVEDTRRALSYLCSAFYGHPQRQMRLVGVTGTNGKTTVSRLVYEILTRSGIKAGLIGTVGCIAPSGRLSCESADPNANMTTPDPEQLFLVLRRMLDEGVEVVVMEVTSHALHFSKVAPLEMEIGVFTNLSEDHLDLHGTMEAYFMTKAKMLERCRYRVVNCDDRYGRMIAERSEGCYSCSMEGRGTICNAEDVREMGSDGLEYKLTSPTLRLRVRSPMAGRFNVMNTMQAAICAHLLGVRAADIQASLAHSKGAEGRLERIPLDRGLDFTVYLDYAHTPDALENLCRAARGFLPKGGRLVLLFGCGGDRDRAKRPMMGKIATMLSDMAVITSDNSRGERTSDIIREILSGAESCACFTVIEDRREAIEYVIRNARGGDVILLAGKGHECYEIGEKGRKPFSEKEIVAEAIRKYHSSESF